MILSTDSAYHFADLGKLKSRLSSSGKYNSFIYINYIYINDKN